jgi:hypothetical protein
MPEVVRRLHECIQVAASLVQVSPESSFRRLNTYPFQSKQIGYSNMCAYSKQNIRRQMRENGISWRQVGRSGLTRRWGVRYVEHRSNHTIRSQIQVRLDKLDVLRNSEQLVGGRRLPACG